MNPFVRPRRLDAPELRLIVFHHAGGSAASYYRMVRDLPENWDLLLLDLPGRGKRHAEPPLERLPEVLEQVAADVRPWLGGTPLALFGHSFGAVVALETARSLQAGGVTPLWVGVSGRVPPDHHPVSRLSHLDDEGLMAKLVAMGGMPERVNAVPQFVEHCLRITRSDLRAVESYAPDPDRVPLDCPLTVFCGSHDAWAPPAAMSGWEYETGRAHRRHVFPGGHFYFQGAALSGFTKALATEIETVAPRAARGC